MVTLSQQKNLVHGTESNPAVPLKHLIVFLKHQLSQQTSKTVTTHHYEHFIFSTTFANSRPS